MSPLAEARSRALDEDAAKPEGVAAPVTQMSALPPRAAEALAEALAETEESDRLMPGVEEPEPGYLLDDALGELEPIEPEAPAAAPAASAASAAAAALPPADSMVLSTLRELERRLAQIETRLEQMVDARDRVDRQLAAQTEELRVQRAAIARTQRVLRSVVRPEDVATEPVSRDPSRGPGG
jgi:hypothetical protein